MRSRCSIKTDSAYKYYGGNGITVCKEWDESFTVFKEWALENGYRENLQLDRRKNDEGYSPENCRFVTRIINMRNRSSVKLNMQAAEEIRSLYATGKYTKTEIGRMFGITRQSATSVIKNEIWKQLTPRMEGKARQKHPNMPALKIISGSQLGSWIDPGLTEKVRQAFSDLFYSGVCNRRLSPENHWSYQYQIKVDQNQPMPITP